MEVMRSILKCLVVKCKNIISIRKQGLKFFFFFFLLANPENVQTNYFYGDKPVYGKNGDDTKIGSTTDDFRTYTIDW
jgi:hypothetical protein